MFWKVLARVAIVILSAGVLVTAFEATPAAKEAHPPHVRPAAMGGGIGFVPEVNVADVAAWIEGEQRAERERQAEEARALAEARVVAPRQVATGGESHGGDCAALSAELGLPEAILWRESRCRWIDAPGNCYPRGCLGPAQVDAGHFADVSPWNPSASGACADLDPSRREEYAECVSRLSSGGTNLDPWR